MGAERGTAAERRAQAVASGLRAFADHGVTTLAMRRVADEMGVSEPYVFRLFGSKRAFLLACLDEVESRVRSVFRRAAEDCPGDPLPAMGDGFRALVADGAVTGLWLRACAVAREDAEVARRCRALLAGVLAEVERRTAASPEEVARFLSDGALVVLLQALGVDLAGGSRSAVDVLRVEGRAG